MPLYGAQPPTGYSMKADTWVSSSALLNRMNFALALTAGKVRGRESGCRCSWQEASAASGCESRLLSALEATMLAGDVSKQTHDSIVAQIMPISRRKNGAHATAGQQGYRASRNAVPDASMIAGLLLGSPEFQRR